MRRLSRRALIGVIALFSFLLVGASALYALVITNQTNTNLVLSYGIWDFTSIDLTSDLQGATGPISWSTTDVPSNTNPVFTNTSNTGATLTLYQLLNGPDAGNYTMHVVATAQSGETTNIAIAITVQQRAFSVRGSFTANNKTYNRSAAATIATNSLTAGPIDILDGDDVSLVPVASFANANVGNAKTVSITASSTLTGAQASNYYISLSGSPTATANITAVALTVTPPTFSKTYDKTNTATAVGTPTLNGVLSGDTVTLAGSPTFTYNQTAVGTGISITPSVAYSLSGSTASNYSLTQPTLTGDITKRSLSVTFTGTTRVYDGTQTATVIASTDTRIAGDVLGTITASSSQFTQAGIGTTLTINISGISGNGVDAGNYTFPTTATTTADITARPLTIGGTLQVPSSRVYNQGITATITDASTLTLTNAIAGDVANLSLSGLVAQYANKNVGAGKTVSITSATLAGTARFNYSLSISGAPTATSAITAKPLAVTISGGTKQYDGTTTATVTYADDRIAGDAITVSGTATFDTKAIGNNKTITATGISLSGTDSANYAPNTTATTTANITGKTLTIGITSSGKTYDGNTSATVTYTDNRTAGDVITISGTATYASKTAAAGKTITATGITVSGADAGNYTYNTTATTTATISTRALTIGITSSGKTYDGNTSATVTYSDDRISGDTLTISGTATYATKAAAAGKTITATGITVSGADAGNYTYNTTATTTATIAKRALAVTISGGNKTYDASTTATVTYNDDRVAGDVITVSGTATFDTKSYGTNKTITATGITATSTDGGNYTPNTSASISTATITQRALTIVGTFTASNKVYDSTTTATVTPPASPTLTAVQGADNVSLTGTPSFAFSQANIGTSLAITTSGYSLTGTDSANYTLTLPTLSANITAKALTITGSLSVASTKVYDGTLSASFVNSALLTLSGVASGDSGNASKLALASPVAQYATKTVGTTKTVSVTSASLSGTSAGNYSLTVAGAPTSTANITARALAVTATGVNKTYDGATTATVTLGSDKVAGDTVTLAYTSASFATKIVETGKTVSVTGITISGADSTNYTANTTTTTTANITTRALAVTITATNKVYDGNTTASVTYASDKVAADTLTFAGTATFANKGAATGKTVTATGIIVSGADASNYTANTSATTTANITAKALAVTITANNKTYDGTTTATVSYADDRLAGDVFTVSGTPTFASATVGNTKTVTAASIALAGADSANYSPNTSATATANITVRTLNVTISGGGKTYDASTAATVTYGSDKVAADTITFTGTATYADKTAAAGKTITATGIAIGGASAGNYVLGNTTATTTATISKRTLTISGTFTASNRPYDGTTDATGNVSVPVSPGVTPIQGVDDVTLTGTPVFTYSQSSVGTALAISGSGYSITGADAGNYALTQLSLSSDITARVITIGGSLVVASTKTYDSTTAITITNLAALTLQNVPPADAGNATKLALTNVTAVYSTDTVGTGKTVVLSTASITGTTSSNYTLDKTTTPTATANITLRSLAVTMTATGRVYNATTAASVTYADDRVAGDVFTVSGTATFSDKNIGTNKTVTATNITLTGTDAANYSPNLTTTALATITQRALTVTGTFTVANRAYDATTDATPQITLPVSAGLSDVQAGDDATLSGTPVFTFAQATVANGIGITTTGYSVVGVDAGNYALTQPSFTANITKRPLTIGGTLSVTSTKVYTATTAAAITDTSLLTLVNVPAGDANNASKVALTSLTATYADKNVGNGKLVSVATAALTGTTSGNYTITTAGAPTTTADITQKPITLGFTSSNRTYDGTTAASVTFTDNRIAGDTVTVSGTPTYADKNVGASKTITATNMSISGTDAANYSYNTTATYSASILVRTLAVTITASSKTYDGNANATVVYADNRVAGDVITVTGTATFANKNYGLSKVVTAASISLSGTDASNYSPNTSTTTTANITKRTLVVTITANNKVYDRTTTATVNYFDDRVAGDVLVISSTPTFSDKNVGTAKTVTANTISLSSTDAGNYTQNTTATATADITKRSLTIGISPSNKVYDATNVATASYTDNRVAGDVLTFSSTITFSDKNIGTAKTVTANGISVSNTDAGNYDYNTTATATANITKRPLTVTGTFTIANRQYDATTDATSQVTLPVSAGLSDVQAGDDATLTGTPVFTFAQATVANGIGISTSGYSVVGVDAGNYALTQPSFTANITQRPLTIGGSLVVASTKVYDKGVVSTITDAAQLTLVNVPAGDANNAAKVALTSLGASYSDKNVNTGKTVTLTAASLTGTTASNYTLTLAGAPTTTADITRKSVTISITTFTKVYDATTAATVTYQDTRISGDVFTASGTANFDNKNVGTGKTVTATGITLSGTDSGNYTPNTSATGTNSITAKTLAVTTTASNKVYDRTTAASVVFSDNRIAGDVFTVSATSTFNSKVVATGKTVTSTGITLSGTDSGNYTPNTSTTTTANITLRPLAVTISANSKVYDSTSTVAVTYLDDRVTGDVLTVTGTASFDNKNIGTAKTVTATGIAISGADSGNYTQNTSTTTTANVTVKPLAVTAVADTKVYDATTAATAVYSDDRYAGDVFTVTGTATFATKVAATGKTVTITGITLTGTDANNYSPNATTTSTADITQRPLEVTGTLQAQDKVYDATRTATYDVADLTLVGVQGNDAVGVINPRGRFRTNGNVGVGKIVELTSFQFTGADLGNYAVSVNNSPITYATITARPLVVSITATNKIYDGTDTASVTYSDDRVAADVMTVSGTATFSDKNIGTAKTVTATNITLSGAASGNYTQNTTATTTANITAKTLAVTITATNKTYDGNTTATATYLDNRVAGDVLTVSGTATFASKTVGSSKTVTANSISITGTDAGNYTQNTSTTTTANITARSLAVTITATNKVYDRTTSASVTYNDNRVSGDVLTVSGTPTFSDKNVGTNKVVTAISIGISGTDAANYLQNTSTTTTADITAKSITIGITATNKIYTATTAAAVTYSDNRIAGDVIVASGTANFDDKNIGTAKTVTATGIALTGTDANNYSPNTTATTTANITRRTLTVTGVFTVSPRQYDATTDATSQIVVPQNAGLSDVQAGDDTTLTGTPTFTFAQATVGTAIGITTSGYSLSGIDANNYSLTSPTFSANITQRPLTIGGSLVTSLTKTYDRTTAISITDSSALSLVNVPAGDANTPSKVALTGLAAQYSDKTVASSKTVSLTSASLTGSTSTNYTLTLAGSPTTTADITVRSLAVTITPSNKTYDGNTTASVVYNDNRVAGDALTVSGTATFSDKTVGNAKTITASGISITGADSANYTQNTSTTATANITARALAVTITATSKVYDGNTTASVVYNDNRVAGDDITVSGTSTFASKTVANNKTVTASGIALSGTDASNYSQNTSTTTTANITARSLAVTITPSNKVYDRTTTASVVYNDNRVAGDVFTVSGTPTFSDKNVGTNKIVTAVSISLSGTDAANYSQNTSTTAMADITIRSLVVTITASNKTYDATDAASVVYNDNRVTGDVLTVSGTPTFNNKNVGTAKTVTANSIAITGTDSGNYTQNTTATTTANITTRALAVTIAASNKVYDGNTAASVVYSDNRIAGDILTVSGTSTFSSKTVGTTKTVTASSISLTGTDASNYSPNTSTTTTANITTRVLLITATASDKTYDRTTSASATLSDDRVSGNVLTVAFTTASFADKTAATNKTVTVSGISVTGADAPNYTFATSVTTTATIQQRTLNITATPTNKVYDGTDVASVTYSDDRIAGDALTVSGTASFNSKTAVNGKSVTSTNVAINGADAANYVLPSFTVNAVTTANITPRVVTITGAFTVVNRQYDATTDATSQVTPPSTPGLSDVQLADDVSLAGIPAFTFAQATVGTNIGITTSGYSLAGVDAANYSLTLPTFTANITQRPLTIGGALVVPSSRVYDRTTSATISTPAALTLVNVPAGDANDASKIALSTPVAQFATKDVESNKTVSLTSASLSGSRLSNYTLTIAGSPTATANITAKALAVTISAQNKTYDATTTATVTYTDDRITGDILTVTGTPTFNNKNVGNAKTVTANSIAISGTDSGNYTQNTSATTTANITAKALAITITAQNKTYDATTTATVTYTDDRIAGDILTVTGTPTFANKNVGTAKTVTANSIAISGTDAGNYTQNTTATTTASVTQRSLAVSITALNKVYDANTSASVTYLDNRVSGDVLSVTGTPTFNNKNVGNAKTVTANSIAISGTDSGNYAQNTSATTTANITAKALAVTIAAQNKTYDATTTAIVTYTDDRIAGDILTVTGTPTFNNKNVGNAKTVTANSIAISGTDAGNYTQNTTATTTANITAKTLAVTITAQNKTYDATNSATVTYTDDRIAGDILTVTGTPTFNNKNVGNAKTVTANSIAISGTDAGNYTQNTTATTTANITAKALAITITAQNKTYDATTTATVTYTDDRIAGDILIVTGTPTFANKNVGSAKTVIANSIAISGTDSGNYTQNTSATTTANITAKTLVITITAQNKIYDATDAAATTVSDNRIAGDVLTVSYPQATFANKHVGNAKTVTANSIAISGTDSGNYSHNTTATTTANITRKSLTVVPVADDKTYDATNIATVTYTDNRIAGDVFTISSTAFFDDAELGRNKPVAITSITLTGIDAGNYNQNLTATSSGDITVREITASILTIDADAPLSDSTPTVSIGDLVPGVDTTVTFTKAGSANVVCSLVPQSATEQCTVSGISDGTWTYRARQLIAGFMVAASEQFTITIDTTAPVMTKSPAVASASDTGFSATDSVTSDNTPTITVAEASDTDRAVVTAVLGNQSLQCTFTATTSSKSCVLPQLTDGAWNVTVVLTDRATNVSTPSPVLAVTIDTQAPLASAAPFNAQDNGATTSIDATPKISVAGVAAGDTATVSGVNTKSDKASCSFLASATLNYCDMSTMTSGTWTLTSIVTDAAGNVSPPSATTQLIISAGLAPVTVAKSAVVPVQSSNKNEKVVSINLGTSAALAGVQSVTFIVQDSSGKVVRRTQVKLKPTDTKVSTVVPATLKGAKVVVVTTNQCGVSDGAPKSFNVRAGKTYISLDKSTNNPVLAGQMVLPQIDFAPSEITLDKSDKAQLDKALKEMKDKCGTLLVSGFARYNTTDSKRYLQNLANFRAQAVADYLSSKGLNMWIDYQGFVIKSNDKDNPANRRAELHWTPA